MTSLEIGYDLYCTKAFQYSSIAPDGRTSFGEMKEGDCVTVVELHKIEINKREYNGYHLLGRKNDFWITNQWYWDQILTVVRT